MMKKFSDFVNENITSLVDRYKNQAGTRKEDIVGNTADMKPVDVGLSFYISDRLLEVGDEGYFKPEDYSNINSCGWRFPTDEEIDEMYDAIKDGRIKIAQEKNKYDNINIVGNPDSVEYINSGRVNTELLFYSLGICYLFPKDVKVIGNTTTKKKLSSKYIQMDVVNRVCIGTEISNTDEFSIILVKSKNK